MLKLITAPAAEPVGLAEAKLHLRVDHSADDDLIAALITAAREDAEHRTGRSLVTQTWEQVLSKFPEAISLDMAPVQSVSSVKYTDTAGVEQTLVDGTDYSADLDRAPGLIYPAYGAEWPSPRAQSASVRARYVAGYAKTYAITAITQAASAVVTVGTHTISAGDRVLFGKVVGMTGINGLTGTVTSAGATTITVNINSTGFGAYTSGGIACHDTVPAPIKQWILLRVGSLYENRESVFAGQAIQAAPRDFADGLLDRYKVFA